MPRQQTLAGLFPEVDFRAGEAVTTQFISSILVKKYQVFVAEDDQLLQQGKIIFETGGSGFSAHLFILLYEADADESVIAYELEFTPAFFAQFASDILLRDYFSNPSKPLAFSVDQEIGNRLEEISGASPGNLLEGINKLQSAVILLARSLQNINAPVSEEEVPACRFLAYDSEREKILEACGHIQNSDGKPFTIRELSRKVAMNECYLKKGFKALTGKTIHEYQQDLRIQKAKEMLKVQGTTVTDVALALGYSSISHFSTAFKRVTGIKPCELLA